jgi:hypothetical protein
MAFFFKFHYRRVGCIGGSCQQWRYLVAAVLAVFDWLQADNNKPALLSLKTVSSFCIVRFYVFNLLKLLFQSVRCSYRQPATQNRQLFYQPSADFFDLVFGLKVNQNLV